MTRHDVNGKVVLIAGGAKNLGGLLSRDFAAKGAKLVIHYNSDSTKDDAEKTLQEVKAVGAEAILLQGDLTDISNISKLFDEAVNAFGGVDIAINTVGKVLKKPFVDTTEKEYDSMSDINSKVAYFFIQEAGKKLNDNGKICTIVTSLLAAYTGLYSTYEGLKAPVEHFTRAASKEFGGRGISVTAVAPGPMDTPFFYGQESEDAVAYHKSASALGGLTDIKDIAPLVEFLVTEGWWITGQTIFANGGYTTR
ncbi:MULTISPECIES: SDR family oxidoreductase [Chryseobacterium]|uniref:NAD(P)-dependent dehydrogenase (Short-subunit alcohol dehydrogenase family) n=1 Tax=Chryseobacterium camelliae TaxID=1265445 RepID=A0ABU0TI66_9FLAO|nr:MULTISPECIES: SDR family oxidoreductase [Chryseobacterium]MDT3409403.1 NAD(P)-dependent dehydrogenase (short-subunit alcohol dehydrogenase family) [Pseudacidovorax intermedius]MDQ1096732.1 NAD(P)-dependent dehydrogenase (short-subunit alcohol dehydrogenase family) [Chryseobacterium camelliae]MDQ1100676.1 NAD(P)-dependent dehydrogenase (short-subunit alcohol dehydrogenase family) [Chryseobacterium sp. SORGH_AS_1048]MDR6088014.1 NAD(P)-dependent dehydrogenase (short-subunit alcohol dehydrogena